MRTINRWNIEFGGRSKEELLFELRDAKMCMNAYATLLFMNDDFKTAANIRNVSLVEASSEGLGLSNGDLFEEIVTTTRTHNLKLCDLELACYLRLEYKDQAEGYNLTVASEKLTTDEKYPNGFYLSVNGGFTWLRGYYSTADWVWDKDDKFVFVEAAR